MKKSCYTPSYCQYWAMIICSWKNIIFLDKCIKMTYQHHYYTTKFRSNDILQRTPTFNSMWIWGPCGDYSAKISLTMYTFVTCFQVRLEVFRTRLSYGFNLRHADLALGLAGTLLIQVPEHWSLAADETIVTFYTATNLKYKAVINTLRPRKMDAISQTTLSNAFSWMKMFEFRLTFHWRLFPRVQSTIFQQWFR